MKEIIGNPKYKSVYIAGPISGIKNDNKEQFEEFQNKFIDLGFHVINPHDLHTDHNTRLMNKKLKSGEITEKEHHGYFMRVDLSEMCKCDLVAVLPEWEKSKGANIEVRTANDINIPVICAVTLKELF